MSALEDPLNLQQLHSMFQVEPTFTVWTIALGLSHIDSLGLLCVEMASGSGDDDQSHLAEPTTAIATEGYES